MTATLDSNVLIYALDNGDPDRRAVAREVVGLAMLGDVVLTGQAIGETIKVVRAKGGRYAAEALAEIERWTALFPTEAAAATDMIAAAHFAARHRLQFWDSVIWQVARRRGAAWFVSEDLQDGQTIDGMTIVNPFNPANRPRLSAILAPDGPALKPLR